jgi:hypothetical protein
MVFYIIRKKNRCQDAGAGGAAKGRLRKQPPRYCWIGPEWGKPPGHCVMPEIQVYSWVASGAIIPLPVHGCRKSRRAREWRGAEQPRTEGPGPKRQRSPEKPGPAAAAAGCAQFQTLMKPVLKLALEKEGYP